MWRGHDVRDSYGAAPKQLRHPRVGLIALHHSMFAVDGRPVRGMLVYTPATPEDAGKIRRLLKPRRKGRRR
jgi:hypothetical protein